MYFYHLKQDQTPFRLCPRFMKLAFSFSLLILSYSMLVAADKPKKSKHGPIVVEIDYDTKGRKRSVTLFPKRTLTALEATMHVTKVATAPAGNYVLVSAIGGKSNIKNKRFWVFYVNGKYAQEAPIHHPLYPGDTLTWVYKKLK